MGSIFKKKTDQPSGTKRVTIVRHGKSSWEYDGISDLDRPLLLRGINDAKKMAKRLPEDIAHPDKIISSPANRALHTGVMFARYLEYPFTDIIIDETIYGAYEEEIYKLLESLDDSISSVFLFGHNPLVTNMVNLFRKSPIDNLPTTGVGSFSFDCAAWSDIRQSRVKSEYYDYPKRKV